MPERLDNFLSENPIDLILLNHQKSLEDHILLFYFLHQLFLLFGLKNHGSTFDS